MKGEGHTCIQVILRLQVGVSCRMALYTYIRYKLAGLPFSKAT